MEEGSKWQPQARLALTQSGLSPLPDSLGPLKDDMLLVEARGPQDNRSFCALEPSGCTPLLSRASTVSAGGPSCLYLPPQLHLKPGLKFSLYSTFPLLCARPCAGSQWPLKNLPASPHPPLTTILPSCSLVVS